MAVLPTKELTSEVIDFINRYLNKGGKYTLEDIETALIIDPKMAIGAELRSLFLLSLLGEYSHPEEEYQAEIRANFAGLKGSWQRKLLELMKYQTFGFGVTEKTFKVRGGKAVLTRLNTLNQSRCYWHYSGHLEYRQLAKTVKLPQEAVIHLINQSHLLLGYSPEGIPLALRAMPYHELSKKIMAVLAIAALKQATPLLVGKTKTAEDVILYGESGQPLLDENGRALTIKKGRNMYEELLKAENSSVTVIDENDEVMAIAQQTNGEFLKWVLYYLDACKLWSFLISPILVGTSESGVGDSNLAQTHLATLKTLGRADMRIFGDTLVEEIVRPILSFNHGELEDYGHFPVSEEDNPNTVALLNAIAGAARTGLISRQDKMAINRFKQLAGIA